VPGQGHVRLGESLLACHQPRHALEELDEAERLAGKQGGEIAEYIRKQVEAAKKVLQVEERLWNPRSNKAIIMAQMRRIREEERTKSDVEYLEVGAPCTEPSTASRTAQLPCPMFRWGKKAKIGGRHVARKRA